jgi:hypothetical protein
VRVIFVLTLCACVYCGVACSSARAEPVRSLRAVNDAIYAYTDDDGRLVYVNRLQDVPVLLRRYARRVDRDAQAGVDADSSAPLLDWVATPARASEPVLYKYRGRNGRTTYTNLAESVPVAQRATAKLDLRQVSLNTKVGTELDQQLKAQYDKLRESSFCRAIEVAANEPFWRRAWDDHAPLVVCGGAILVFLLITPWMVRKVGGAPWARALSLAIPVLGFAGLMAFVLMKSGRSLSQLRERASPCAPGSWAASATRSDKGLVEHMQLLNALKTETAALEKIHAESL